MSADTPAVSDLLKIASPVYPAMALLAGMQLEVFSHLAKGPRSVDEVASEMGADSARLTRLLYALASTELLTIEDGLFANGRLADHFLVRGKPGYMGGTHELWSDLWSATMQTAESVRSGRPAVQHDFEEMSGDELRALFRGLHAGAVNSGRILAKELELSGGEHLLDVGGGSGGLAIGACQSIHELRATVADLPRVIEIAKEFIAETDFQDRIALAPANLLTGEIEGGFDVAILRNVIQILSADDAARIINNVAKSLASGGQIHIVGWVLEDSRLSPPAAVNFDLVFLNIYDDGAAHTKSAHRSWLEAAGFNDITFRPAPPGGMPPGTMLVSAVKI